MFRFFIFGILASVASVCFASDYSRNVDDKENSEPSMLVLLTGEILPGELDAIKRDIESNLPEPPESYSQRLFVLASYGGDSAEAMRIGRYIRALKGTTMIPETGKCYSACVFVLAGGVERIIQGPVAINWPGFELRTDMSEQEGLSRVLSLTSDYFEEMNIPSSLAEDMYRIPPSELKLLSENELLFYFSQ